MIAGPASRNQVSRSFGSIPDQNRTTKKIPSHRKVFFIIDLACSIRPVPFAVQHRPDPCETNQVSIGKQQQTSCGYAYEDELEQTGQGPFRNPDLNNLKD
jgi:hypothetical protein